ncbi:MAG TPA: WecB/TagA/CpsF family glycosyltransferase [Chloroflexota bacterium]|nr:WecB/TagA/CpsF family glycosyltransferase [Chloroflexota bacterium]
MDSLRIFGVRVDDVTFPEALALLRQFVASRAPHYVVTPNPEFVMLAQRDAAFRAALNGATLAIPDGGGLLLAARLWGRPFREQVRGTDLVYRLARVGAAEGQRWFLLGAAPGVAEAAGRRLMARYPGLQVVGTFGGSPHPADDDAAHAAIQAAAPVDVLLVAYGAPGQELWMARNVPTLGVPVVMGIGGVLDFISGRVRRAPRWVRDLGLEWLFRLLVQPRRWRRQLALPRFALQALLATPRERARLRATRGDIRRSPAAPRESPDRAGWGVAGENR